MKKLNIDESCEMAELLKTIAHPVRIGILQMLHDGDKNLHELYEQLNCSQSGMSQHIRILRDRGLMGRMFGGVIAEVMGTSVAADEEKFLEFLNP